MLTVAEVMTSKVVTLDPNDDLSLAENILGLAHIRHLPVVDRRGRLVGLVTHRDLLRAAARYSSQERIRTPADTVMTRDLQVVSPDTSVRRAAQLMLDHQIGCVPIVDEEEHLVGIVTEADMVRTAGVLSTEADADRTRPPSPQQERLP